MLKTYFPGAYAPDVHAIDYQKLLDKGYKAVLFDVDNTLVPHNRDATPEAEALLQRVRAIGLQVVLVSNNDAPRMERFLKNLDLPYVCDAEKPARKGYDQALRMLGISAQEAVFVGDQMFVDICGANRAGIDNIMVHYIVVNKKEKIGIRRHIENVVLFFYKLCKSAHKLDDAILKR